MQNPICGVSSAVGNRETAFKPRVCELAIAGRKLAVERKTFFLSIKENHQGRFCRITEEVGGRRDTIIIPASGLTDFAKVFAELVEAANRAEAQRPGL